MSNDLKLTVVHKQRNVDFHIGSTLCARPSFQGVLYDRIVPSQKSTIVEEIKMLSSDDDYRPMIQDLEYFTQYTIKLFMWCDEFQDEGTYNRLDVFTAQISMYIP